MKLVEVIRTDKTEAEVFDRAYAWVGEIGKVAVSCGDTPVCTRCWPCLVCSLTTSSITVTSDWYSSHFLLSHLLTLGLYREPAFGS